ncbi:MAG TPA: glycoside hydrolase family 25 protein, partial [Enterococcus aquimarinus]|nr:glycoside hydrolase family 25 protein [Enterococcus aquimarinus]
MNPKPIILDISEWQVPSQIHYDVLSRQIGGVIVRIQYGSNYEDKHYRTHLAAFQKYNVPVAVYAWVRGTSITDMEKEASDFYRRAKAFQPSFWWLDVEEQSMTDMRSGVEAYRKKLKSLGAKKVGAYIANHLYRQFNIDTKKFDAIWLPTYGQNTGIYQGNNPTATNEYHLHQYTDQGRLAGYSGKLDLNRIAKGEITDYFPQAQTPLQSVAPKQDGQRYVLLFDVHLRKEPSTKATS